MTLTKAILALLYDLYMFVTMVIYWISVLLILKPLQYLKKTVNIDLLSPLIKLTKIIGNL